MMGKVNPSCVCLVVKNGHQVLVPAHAAIYSRKDSTDKSIAFVDVLLDAGHQIICCRFNNLLAFVTKTVDLCVLALGITFKNCPRETLFVFSGDLGCTQDG
jgi:hypothetical protein